MERRSNRSKFSLEKAERLSKLLFPRWDQVCALTRKIDTMRSRRVELLRVESSSIGVSDDMAMAMMLTSDLLDEVEHFRSTIKTRIQALSSESKEAHLTIQDMERDKVAAKVLIVQQGGMLPPDDAYGDWEYDSDDGVGRGLSNIANFDAGKPTLSPSPKLKLTHVAVINAEKTKIVEITDQINFEATMDKMLREEMSEFAVEADMTSVELKQWDRDTERCMYTNTPMPLACRQMEDWFVKKFYQAVEEEEEEERRVKNTMVVAEAKEIATRTVLTTKDAFIPKCFTCLKSGHVDRDCLQVDIAEEKENRLDDEGKHARLANRGQSLNRSMTKSCTICRKPGHIDEYCPIAHLDEEQEENACTHCGRDGHQIGACWRLYPELRRAYLQKRKPFCGNCYKAGHYRDACPSVGVTYKYGLRPFGA
ncbi:hypothetical protein VTL71DRAFT_3582 [Oculimacula yallundae]|uniref:CCHC-type domain-containing protein n=1 Tax=Oculimacula yallundae TaxID=86028 RepID=A0ABR4C8S1_9HELO